jgi:arylsulfatase A-like enzyme
MKKPNFLIFLPDQQRADWLGFNSNLPLNTPNIDKIASAGVVFDNAFSSSPLCAPARACLASGRHYKHCGVSNNQANYPLAQPTYYQALRDSGYRVCGVGKFDLHKDTSDFSKLYWGEDGSNLLDEWGFTEGIDNEGKIDGIESYLHCGRTPRGPYTKYLEDKGLIDSYIEESAGANAFFTRSLPREAYCDDWLSANGLEFLRNFSRDTPWHLVINFVGPHNPMDVTSEMRERYENVDFPLPAVEGGARNPEYSLNMRRNYAAMIENIDKQIEKFINLVKERGEMENTFIIYMSDHGEMLGDHSVYGKCLWYSPSVKIPLIVAGPGVKAGTRTKAVVNTEDITALILEQSGCHPLSLQNGRSFSGVLSGKTEKHREYAYSSLHNAKHGWNMICDGRYKYVKTGANELLFDSTADSNEVNNIAGKDIKMLKSMRDYYRNEFT